MMDPSADFSANPVSFNGNSHLLAEVAGLLQAGRLDGDLATMARAPRAHPEIGQAVARFSLFADDQYQDLVALLGALATKLNAAGQEYVHVDEQAQGVLDKFLLEGVFVPPESR